MRVRVRGAVVAWAPVLSLALLVVLDSAKRWR